MGNATGKEGANLCGVSDVAASEAVDLAAAGGLNHQSALAEPAVEQQSLEYMKEREPDEEGREIAEPAEALAAPPPAEQAPTQPNPAEPTAIEIQLNEPATAPTQAARDETVESMSVILCGALVDAYRECKDLVRGTDGASDVELPKECVHEEEGFVPRDHEQLKKLYQKMPIIMRESACTKAVEVGPQQWRSIWKTSRLELGEYGVGIQLYFDLLIAMGVLFCILFLINFPTVVMCLMGSGIDDNPATKGAASSQLSWFTIANLGSCEGSTLCSIDRDLPRPLFKGSSTDLRDVTWIIGMLDGISCVVFLLFGVIFLNWWIPKQVLKHDKDNVTAADFAIEVSGLPWCLGDKPSSELHLIYEEEIKEHFKKVLRKCPDWDAAADPDPVHEVALVRDYDGHVRDFIGIGNMRKMEANEKARLRIAEHHGLARKVEPLRATITKLEKEIQESDDKMGAQGDMLDVERGVCSAFVMLKTEPLKDYIVTAYSPYQDWLSLLNMPTKLQFHGRKLWVNQACEPLDLYWENLDYGRWKRWTRQAIMLIVAVAFIIFCTMLLINLRSYKVQGMNQKSERAATFVLAPVPNSVASCMTICNWQMFTDTVCTKLAVPEVVTVPGANGVVVRLTNLSLATASSPCDNIVNTYDNRDYCLEWIAYELPLSHSHKCSQITTTSNFTGNLAMYSCPYWNQSSPNFNTQCQRMQKPFAAIQAGIPQKGAIVPDHFCTNTVKIEAAEMAKERALAERRSPELDPVVSCFCTQVTALNPMILLQSANESPEAAICEAWSSGQGWKGVITLCSIIGVILVNIVLDTLFYYMDEWTRHGTMTKLTMSSMNKLFFALYVNTGIIFLLVSANFHGQFTLDKLAFLGLGNVGKGPFSDLTASWFVTSGQDFFLTITCNLLCFTLTPLAFSFILNPFFIRFFRQGLVTESALRDVYKLPEWPLSLRLAQTVTTFFCVMMFCGGMPLLYLVGAAYCGISYWTDKASLLRGSQLPPTYHEDMVVQTVRWVSTAGFVHCCITSWMYGLQEIFPSNWSRSVGLFEFLLGTTIDEYNQIMALWDQYSESGVDNPHFTKYLDARALDMGHEGAIWVSYMVCFYVLYFFFSHFLWGLIIRPFSGPVIFIVKRNLMIWFPKSASWAKKIDVAAAGHDSSHHQHSLAEVQRDEASLSARSGSTAGATEEHLHNVMHTKEVHKIFSYKMESNPKYEAAYKALKFCETNDPVP